MCSSRRYSCVTCIILSNFCNFSQFVLSTNPLLLYQFLSSYQIFVVLSNFCHFLTLVIYSPFTLSTHPTNEPAIHTTNTTLFPVLSCAGSLRKFTFLTHPAFLAIVPIWYRGTETWQGGLSLWTSDTLEKDAAWSAARMWKAAARQLPRRYPSDKIDGLGQL